MKRALSISMVLCVFGSVVLVMMLSVLPAQANPTVRYVAPGGNCGGPPNCYASIQAAIDAAVNGDEVRVAAGIYSSVSSGQGITAVVRLANKKIILRGGYAISDWNQSQPENNPTVIDANGNGVGLFINYQADIGVGAIVVDGFSITEGSATLSGAGTDSGGGIFIDHTTHVFVTVQNCEIYGNVAEDGSGAGIWTTRSDSLHILDNEIHDNAGSAVVVTYGDYTVVTGNTITNNAGDGLSVISDLGGVEISGNEVMGNQGSGINVNTVLGGSLTNNIVTDNHTTGGGGGLDIAGAVDDLIISNNTIRENSALQGGGIDISGSVAEIRNNLIEANGTTPVSNGGGGVYVDAGSTGAYILVAHNHILNNTSTNQGGGLLILGEVDVIGNTITGNTASSGGGMIATAKGKISNNLISENTAQSGGGIRTVNAVGLLLERNRLIDNHATNGAGGGMNLWGGFFMDVTLEGNQVLSNTATTKGGGIYLECPANVDPVDMANTVLAHNVAAAGSGLYATGCAANMAYSTVSSNRDAGGDGVGFYLRDPYAGTASYVIENAILTQQTIGIYVESGHAYLEATFWGADAWSNDANTGGPGMIDPGLHQYQGDPAFVDPQRGDYHIRSASPVIDKGIDTWSAVDMDGQIRHAGETDLGADEYGQLVPVYLPAMWKVGTSE
ncbi:MAG: right-handed parallel beta-helix repeat-containing protein [Anaerolineales bacterium]|nr:right-handed parallel beta-helix repeat-containing protein [Anaerolineales bacterium]